VIGAVGVSGSTVENDRAVAEAGVAAVEETAETTEPDNPAVFDQKSGGGGAAGGVVGS
jgi:hypothetical protein